MTERIELAQGDITTFATDAIVNAAKTSLLGGGGVDGAIHRAAGPELVIVCRLLGGCKTGEAKITEGFRLSARFVIHTVGPVWQGGDRGEDGLLANCYRSSLRLARDNGLRSVAFPAVSTGIYGFPAARAARIALTETLAFLRDEALLEKVVFVAFDPDTHAHYVEALRELTAGGGTEDTEPESKT